LKISDVISLAGNLPEDLADEESEDRVGMAAHG
jgi:hypothetical protein